MHAIPLLRDRPLVDGHPAAHVCRQFLCERPVTQPDDLRERLWTRRSLSPQQPERRASVAPPHH